jgi:hypothetical protein
MVTSGLSTIDGRGKGFYNSSHSGGSIVQAKQRMSASSEILINRLTGDSTSPGSGERISFAFAQDVSVDDLKQLRAMAEVKYNEDRGDISSIISTDYVHGCVVDDLLDEVFSSYNDFFKFNIINSISMAFRKSHKRTVDRDIVTIMRNVLDMDNDGMISERDFRHLLIVSRLKFRRMPEAEMDFMEKRSARRHRRETALMTTQTEAVALHDKLYHAIWKVRKRAFIALRTFLHSSASLKAYRKRHWDVVIDSIAGLLSIACSLSARGDNSAEISFHSRVVNVYVCCSILLFFLLYLLFVTSLSLYDLSIAPFL